MPPAVSASAAPLSLAPPATRAEKLRRLAENPAVPVLIVGGGINGAGTFRDLALQGVDCVIVDKGDWCSGTSAAPSRLIHGGLKYLETGEFRLVAESAHERNRLLRNAPHLVKPLPVTMPLRSWTGGIVPALQRLFGAKPRMADRGLLVVELGLSLYDWFGRKARTMPRHTMALQAQTRRRFPAMDKAMVGCATYYDAQVTQAERLCFELVADGEAAHPGAIGLNYMACTAAGGGRLQLRDGETGHVHELAPQVVINAAGPWIDRVNQAVGLNKTYIGGTKGSHLLVDNPALVRALGGEMIYFGTADGRIILVYPFMGRALVGATDLRADDPDDVVCSPEEIDYLIGHVRAMFPGLALSADQIAYHYAGIRPLPAAEGVANVADISRDHSIKRDTLPGSDVPVLSLVGGKWTTFRAFAAETVDVVLTQLGRERRAGTADRPIGGGRDFPAGPEALRQAAAALAARSGIAQARAAQALDRYGSTATLLLDAGEGPDEALRNLPAYGTRELRAIARREGIVTLSDLLFRRTPIALAERLTRAGVEEIAAVVAPVLGWAEERRAAEVERAIVFGRDKHGMRLA